MVFGTFDILHKGHEYFLKESKKLGTYLIVIIGRDKNVKKFKNKHPVYNENNRLINIKKIPEVDEVILGREDHDYSKIIEEKNPDIICLGYDQKDLGLEKYLIENKLNIKIVRIKPYKEEKYKSSILREKINN